MNERLDKILASQNLGSRKEAGALIRRGAVAVNGQTVRKPETKADPERDEIAVEGRVLTYRRHVYIMMNKPAGVLSAANDPRATTVIDLVPESLRRRGLFPAGRLDKDTTGLLIITDDGDYAHRMLAPASHVYKLYEARLDTPVVPDDAERFAEGLDLGDFTSLPAELIVPDEANPYVARVWIREGKFHQVKRMFHACGHEVEALRRLRVGGLSLDPDLPEGACRLLTQYEADAVFS